MSRSRNGVFLLAVICCIFTCLPLRAQNSAVFSPAQRALIASLRTQGGLKVGALPGDGVDRLGQKGFYVELAKNFAAYLSLPISFHTVQANEVFGNGTSIPDQVYSDPNFAYQPAAFATSDIVIGAIQVMPWRGKLMLLVPVLPLAADQGYATWALKKSDSVLDGLLSSFLRSFRDSGGFARLYESSYGSTLQTYYARIGFHLGQEIFGLNLSDEERSAAAEIRTRGTLRIASRIGPDAYDPQSDGSIRGFDYWLAQDLARTIGVRLSVRPVKAISDFFTDKGVWNPKVTTDDTMKYVPDLIKEVDIYANPFSITPWRERLLSMIPIHPAGIAFAGPHADLIHNFKDLNGLRIVVPIGAFQESMLGDLQAKEGFRVTYVRINPNDDPIPIVQSGKADLWMDGTMFLAKGMQNLKSFKISPLKLDLQSVAWAVSLENPGLASFLRKYIDRSLSDGTVATIFRREKGIDFDLYLGLIAQ